MDEGQLMQYMGAHNGLARIGKEDTLKSAQELEKRSMVEKVGESKKGEPIYELTDAGKKSLASGKGGMTLRKFVGALQDYASGIRDDNGGSSDLSRVAGMKVGDDPEWDVTKRPREKKTNAGD